MRFTVCVLLALVLPAPLPGISQCSPLPTLRILDRGISASGNTSGMDRSIEGTAFKDGYPLRFAEVRLYSDGKIVQSIFTDEHGRFLLEGLHLGFYKLSLDGIGVFSLEVAAPKFTQQFYYGFSSNHGCLSWGFDSN